MAAVKRLHPIEGDDGVWSCYECASPGGDRDCEVSGMSTPFNLQAGFPLYGPDALFCYSVCVDENGDVLHCRDARVDDRRLRGVDVVEEFRKDRDLSCSAKRSFDAFINETLLPGTAAERRFREALHKSGARALRRWKEVKADFAGLTSQQAGAVFDLFKVGFAGDAIRELATRADGGVWNAYSRPDDVSAEVLTAKLRPRRFFSRLTRPARLRSLGKLNPSFFRQFTGWSAPLVDFSESFLLSPVTNARDVCLEDTDVVGPLSEGGRLLFAREDLAVVVGTLRRARRAGALEVADGLPPESRQPGDAGVERVNELTVTELRDKLAAIAAGGPVRRLTLYRYLAAAGFATRDWTEVERLLELRPPPAAAGPVGPADLAPAAAVAVAKAEGGEFLVVPTAYDGAGGGSSWSYSLRNGCLIRPRLDGRWEQPNGAIADADASAPRCALVDGVTLVPVRCLRGLCDLSVRIRAAVLPDSADGEVVRRECGRVSLCAVAFFDREGNPRM